MKVKDIMSKSIVSLKPTDTITDASKMMKFNRISCLPIIENGRPIGIITTTDLVNIYTSAHEERHIDPWDEVSKFMSSPAVCIDQDADVKTASEIMQKNKFHHLIVEDENKELVGILSTLDIARSID